MHVYIKVYIDTHRHPHTQTLLRYLQLLLYVLHYIVIFQCFDCIFPDLLFPFHFNLIWKYIPLNSLTCKAGILPKD